MNKPNRRTQSLRHDLEQVCKIELPWERGARRKDMIARRKLAWPPKAECAYERKSA